MKSCARTFSSELSTRRDASDLIMNSILSRALDIRFAKEASHHFLPLIAFQSSVIDSAVHCPLPAVRCPVSGIRKKHPTTYSAAMSLWVDKYRPRQLDDLHYHTDLSARLKSLVSPDTRKTCLVKGKRSRTICACDICLTYLSGSIRRLPTYPILWSIRSRKESELAS